MDSCRTSRDKKGCRADSQIVLITTNCTVKAELEDGTQVANGSKVYGDDDPDFADAVLTGAVGNELSGIDLTDATIETIENSYGFNIDVVDGKITGLF